MLEVHTFSEKMIYSFILDFKLQWVSIFLLYRFNMKLIEMTDKQESVTLIFVKKNYFLLGRVNLFIDKVPYKR